MNKTKGLLTINKSKNALKGIETIKKIKTIEDLKQALEQDIMRSKEKEERKCFLIEFIITNIGIIIVEILPLILVIITS